jgi:hypothetical protein
VRVFGFLGRGRRGHAGFGRVVAAPGRDPNGSDNARDEDQPHEIGQSAGLGAAKHADKAASRGGDRRQAQAIATTADLQGMRRIHAVAVSIAVALAAAGCGPYDGLRGTVQALTPPDADRIGRCQEFGAYVIEEPGYGCAYFVRGTQAAVVSALAQDLEREGFESVCHPDPLLGLVEVQAKRGETMVYAEVSEQGSIITMSESGEEPLNISRTTRYVTTPFERAPKDAVILKLTAATYPDRTPRSDWPAC